MPAPVEQARVQATGGASRIAPRLWMGPQPPGGMHLARAGFHDVFLLTLPREEDQPARAFPQVIVHRAPIDDGEVTPELARRAVSAGREVADLLATGRRVLVTCMQGRNRSGLVTAIALMASFNLTPDTAIEWVRQARNKALPANRPALANPAFNAFLRSLRAGGGYAERQGYQPRGRMHG